MITEINSRSRFHFYAAYAFSLCAFVLLGFSAPRCAAAVGPVITSPTSSPAVIAAKGANVTVMAKVSGVGSSLKSVILYETTPGGSNINRTAPMVVGSDGVSYSATVPVDLNTNTSANGERLFIEVYDLAGNRTDYTVATQGYSGVAASGSMPILITGDASVTVLSPSSVLAGGPGITLTFAGNNFVSGAAVLFNGLSLVPKTVLQTQISVNVPASLIAQSGA